MNGVAGLMKEGSKLLSGREEATLRNIEACQKFSRIVRTSLGPQGMNKMVINHLDKLYVTNDAATIIRQLEVEHPAAKMLIMASQQQASEVGDGTNFVTVFGGELLGQAESLIRQDLHPSDVITGYELAGKEVLKYLDELCCHTVSAEALSDRTAVAKALYTAVAAKQFGYAAELSEVVAEACCAVLPKTPAHFNVDNVRVVKIPGGGVADTRTVSGFVVDTGVEGTVKHIADGAKIAVFVAGIDLGKTENKGTLVMKKADELANFSAGEEKLVEDAIAEIASTGVNCVVAGGPVSEMSMHFLEKHKIMVVKMQSKFQMRRLCKAVKATPLVRLGKPVPEEIGHCSTVSVDEIGSRPVTRFAHADSAHRSGIATIIVRGSVQSLLDDVERTIDNAVNVYKSLCKDGRFVPGAGASDISLATRIARFADTCAGLEQYSVRKYAEALEVVPRILAENAGMKSTEAISDLYAAHSKDGGDAIGVDVEDSGLCNAVERGVLDHLVTKQWGLKFATAAVTQLLRIDQIIMAKPAGGPKPPSQRGPNPDYDV